MPILNLQLGGEGPAPDGSAVPLAPQQALRRRGPILQVTVGLGQPFAEQVLLRGDAIPSPISGMALIDTGATRTCIDREAAERLGLPAIDVVRMRTALDATSLQNVYPIQVEFTATPVRVGIPRAVGAALSDHGLLILLGRDALEHMLLVYNGVTGQITLSL